MPAVNDNPSLFGPSEPPTPTPVKRTLPAPAKPVAMQANVAPLPDDKAVWRWARGIWHEFEAWEAALATGIEMCKVDGQLDEFVRMGVMSLRQAGHRRFFRVEAKCHVPGLDPDPAPATPAVPASLPAPIKHEPLPKAPFQPVAGSIAGAYKADETSETRRAMVFAALLHAGVSGLTREEIARETGIKESSLCGRLAELKESGTVIEPEGLKRLSSSGVMVQVYVLARFAKHFEPQTGGF
jgi:hypothetical protein